MAQELRVTIATTEAAVRGWLLSRRYSARAVKATPTTAPILGRQCLPGVPGVAEGSSAVAAAKRATVVGGADVVVNQWLGASQ
jgi:hypothetical protein